MTTDLKPTDPKSDDDREPWFKVGQLLLLVVLFVAVLVLCHLMVRNRFFQGGRINPHSHLTQ